MYTVADMRLDRRRVITALPFGPLLTLLGYLALTESSLTISDTMLLGLIAFPTALVLLAAALAALLSRDAGRWVSTALGVAAGTALMLVVVLGGISLIAWLISDPG
jgi:hypothetical protein